MSRASAPPTATPPPRRLVLPRPSQRDARALLAVLLGTGRTDAAEQAEELLQGWSLAGLARLSADELVGLFGLARGAARRVAAACALARLLQHERADEGTGLQGPEAVARVLRPYVAGLEQEAFYALLVDAKHRLRRVVHVSTGSLTSSIVHPREVFRVAVREGAAALIVGHNHPSGDPAPSAEDLAVTRRLHEAGELLGVPLLDHLVLGDPGRGAGFVSIRQSHGLPPRGTGSLRERKEASTKSAERAPPALLGSSA